MSIELKTQIDALQKDVAQLTVIMQEKAVKDLAPEVKELSDKLVEVQKELSEKKIQFANQSGSQSTLTAKELSTRADELFIAKHLCVNKETGSFDKAAWSRIVSEPVYADAIKAFGDVSAMTTTGSGTGDNFIPEGFSSQMFEEIWLALEVGALFGRIKMPNSKYTFPFNPSRIIAKPGSEGGTVTKSVPTTAEIVFNAKKIMSIVEMTDEFEQDSIVPALNFLRKQLIDGFALAQETMCLNGDTGTAIYSSAALISGDVRSLVKGIRADAMTAATSGSLAITGGCTAANIRLLRAKMGKYGKSPSDLALVVSIADYNNLLTEASYQTLYSYGPNAVILKGELGRIDNIPIIVSELIPKAGRATDAPDVLGGLNASGVFDNSTTTKTTCVLVNRSGYMWGDRKEFSLELWRNPLNQTTNLIGAQRLDFEKIAATTATTCAVGYNY